MLAISHFLLTTEELHCELFLKRIRLSQKGMPLIQSPSCPNSKAMHDVPQNHLH